MWKEEVTVIRGTTYYAGLCPERQRKVSNVSNKKVETSNYSMKNFNED
jgi:hypothetical protein